MIDEFRLVPLEQLHESPLNPRRHWSEASLQELTESIRQVGVLTPLLVRPNADGFEIAAGHRRYRAAIAAGVAAVPARIVPMDDAAFLEILTIENLQREDVHPLDEAVGYRQLMDRDRAYTPEAIAAKVGKSTSYVYQRLKLLALIPEARQAFERDEITAAHAVRLARLPATQQGPALGECFYPLFGRELDRLGSEPAPVSKLDSWINAHVRVDLAAEDTRQYFPELAPEIDAARDAGTLLELSESFMPGAQLGTKDHGAIGRARWTEIHAKRDRCKHVQKGVVVHGGPMRILEVCATTGCPKHFPTRPKADRTTSATEPVDDWRAANARADREYEWWRGHVRPRLIEEVEKATRGTALSTEFISQLLNELSRGYIKDLVAVLGDLQTLPEDRWAQALRLALEIDALWTRESAKPMAKRYGLDLPAIERELRKAHPIEDPTPTPAKKTPARTTRRTRGTGTHAEA